MMLFVMLIIVLIIFAVLMICGNWVDSGENTRWEPEEEEEVDNKKENQWEREKTGGEEPAV